MRVLWLDEQFPQAAEQCGSAGLVEQASIASISSLRQVARQHSVVRVSFIHGTAAPTDLANAECYRVERVYTPAGRLGHLRSAISRVLPNDVYPPAPAVAQHMCTLVARLLKEEHIDLVHVASLHAMRFVPAWWSGPIVLDLRAVSWQLLARQALATSNIFTQRRLQAKALRLRDAAVAAVRRANVTLARDEAERAAIELAVGAPWSIHIVPEALNLAAADRLWQQRAPDAQRLLIFAPDDPATTTSFVRETLALLSQDLPELHCSLVQGPSRRMPPPITRAWLACAGIRVLHRRASLQPVRETAAAAVVLDTSSWGRVQTLEALAAGIPVLAPPEVAKGLGAQSDVHLLTAQSADDYALALLRLLRDPSLAGRLLLRGRQLTRERFLPDAAGAALDAAYSHALTEVTACVLCS